MKIVACRMPDGSAVRVVPQLIPLAWLQAARSAEDVESYVKQLLSAGVPEAEVGQHLGLMQFDRDREIAKLTKFWPEALAVEWVDALIDGGLSEQDALLLMARTAVQDAVEYLITDPVEPEHAPYRSAIAPVGGSMVTDIVRARDLHRGLLREKREPLLAALDVDYQRADEAGDAKGKKAVAARKQALRDATDDPAIENARTLDELKEVLPIALQP